MTETRPTSPAPSPRPAPDAPPAESERGDDAVSTHPLAHLIANAERDIGDLMVLAAVIEDAEFLDEIRDIVAEQDMDLQQIAMTLRLLIEAITAALSQTDDGGKPREALPAIPE